MRARLLSVWAITGCLLSGCIIEDVSSRATPTSSGATIARPALASPSPSLSLSPPPAQSPSPATEGTTYTVQSGDSLSSIAERLYGNGAEWRRIYEANRDRLVTPEALQVGMILRVPPRPSPAPTPR